MMIEAAIITQTEQNFTLDGGVCIRMRRIAPACAEIITTDKGTARQYGSMRSTPCAAPVYPLTAPAVNPETIFF